MRYGIAKGLMLAAFANLAAAQETPAAEMRYLADPARHRVWSLTREGVTLHDATKARNIALVLPGWQWAGAPYGCPPDIALGPQGEALVTSDVLPTLWRIDPETLAVSVHAPALDADTDKDVGFSRIVYSREHGAFFGAGSIPGSLWRIDRGLVRAQKIAPSDPVRTLASRMLAGASGCSYEGE
jgi:hypothetical protein